MVVLAQLFLLNISHVISFCNWRRSWRTISGLRGAVTLLQACLNRCCLFTLYTVSRPFESLFDELLFNLWLFLLFLFSFVLIFLDCSKAHLLLQCFDNTLIRLRTCHLDWWSSITKQSNHRPFAIECNLKPWAHWAFDILFWLIFHQILLKEFIIIRFKIDLSVLNCVWPLLFLLVQLR